MRTTASNAFQATRLLLATAALSGTAIGCVNEPPPQITEEHPEVFITEELTLTEAARQPELDTAFASIDIQADRLIVSYRGAPMIPIAVGNILGGNEGDGYLRRVTAVNDLGNGRMEYLTEEATLPEFFADGAFDIRWVGGTPDETGELATEPLSMSFLRDTRFCNAAGGASAEVLPSLQTSLRPNYGVTFSPFTASATLSGSVTAGVTVNAAANGTFNCAANLGTVLTPAQLSAISWSSERTLNIGSFLRLTVTQNIQPFADVQVNGNFNTGRTTATITGRASARAGFRYADGFETIWEPSYSLTGNFTPLEGGMAHMDASLNAGVTYRITLGAFGVGLNGEARLAANVAGAADVNTCDWTINANAGATLGLSAGALGRNISREWPLVSPRTFTRSGRVRTCSDTNSDAGPRQDTGMAGTARGGMCMASAECAGADICARNGTAMRQCCVGASGAATAASDCCGGMTLVGGRCTLVARMGACEQTADCSGGGICRQAGGALCGTSTGCTCQ
jgi:hypothetical protein